MKFKFINTNNQAAFYAMEDNKLTDIPLFADAVPAGLPSEANDHLDMDLNLHDYLVKNPSETFCVRAIGNSMIDANINSGDVMVVDRLITPNNNDIVLAVLNGEFTVKHIRKSNEELYLMPANEAFQPMKITADMDFHIWGVVTFVIRKTR
jgi:DNA polymerase V